jgi:hypothetical protein
MILLRAPEANRVPTRSPHDDARRPLRNNSVAYSGPEATSYIPFDTDSFEDYATMWQLRLPANCAAHYVDQPWVCALLNYSIPFASVGVQRLLWRAEVLTPPL